MKNGSVVAIHQPNYIPWMGYFYKMNRCDVFVYLDAVQYPRGQSFSPRNLIKTANGPSYLTIPLHVPGDRSGKASYLEVTFANDTWRKKHLRTVEMNYKKAPFFNEVFELYQDCLTEGDEFVSLNIHLIESIAAYLEISTRRVKLSELLDDFGGKSDLIVDICQALDANVYLSGTGGGKAYNNEEVLQAAGIELAYSRFDHPVYQQLWGEFESHLSILDALFNCGPGVKEFL